MIRTAFLPKRLLSLAAAVFFAGLMVVTALPQTVFAAGESYVWSPADNAIIDVTGGDLRPSTLKTTAANGNNFFGDFIYKTGCVFQVQVLLGFNGTGYISFPTSAGGPGSGGPANACNPDLVQSYKGQQVQVTGTRAAPGAETELQKAVNISLYSPAPFGTAIPTVTFTFKQNGQLVTLPVTSPKTSVWLGTGDLPAESERAAQYVGRARLTPGTYQVCFSAIITECQTFTKVLYQPFSKTYGTPYQTGTVNKNINVAINITYTGVTGESRTIGPVSITLQNEASQVVKTVASSSFTSESCDPGDLTPSATCQSPGLTTTSTTTLRATLDNVEPGNYKVCIEGTTVCQNVTKVVAQNADVTLAVAGQAGQDLANANANAEEEDAFCDNFGSLGWALCPVAQAIIDTINSLDTWILSHVLNINTADIFGSNAAGSSGRAFHTAWGILRNIAYALFLILGLVMVISQIMGLDIFDAYTIRKMLPKLVAAAIFIPLLWPLLHLVFDMANDAGSAVYELILAPFGGVGNEVSLAVLFGSTAAAVGIAAGAFFAVGGWGVFFAAGASVLLAVLSAIVILAARDIVVYALVIVSPIAVVCATFEPFKKVFTLWKTFLLTILLSIPAIGAVLAASKVAAKLAISASQNAGDNILEKSWGILLAAVFLAAGYALLWKIFKQLDKISGQLGNVVGSATGKLQKGLADYRSNTMKRRFGEAVAGRRTFGGLTGGLANAAASVTRRAQLAGQPGGSFWNKDKVAAARIAAGLRTADEMVKADNGANGGNDDAMEAIAEVGTRGDFSDAHRLLVARKRRIAASRGVAFNAKEASAAASLELRSAETTFGGTIGTAAMAAASAKALYNSNTSLRKEDWRTAEQSMEDGRRILGNLQQDGVVTNTNAAEIYTSQKGRADRAGAGFAAAMGYVAPSSAVTTTDFLRAANYGSNPGSIIAGRHEAVSALAPQMREQLKATLASGDPIKIGRELAALAGRYDVMGQVSPKNAEIMASEVMSRPMTNPATGQVQTVQEIIDSYRNDPDFLTMRREYGAAAAQQAGAFQYAQAAAQGNAGQPPVVPGAPGGPGGSDRRLKTSIRFLTAVNGIRLYRFRYLHDDRTYVGVMAQDLLVTHPQAVIEDVVGFYRVDYSALGLRMVTLTEWEKQGIDAVVLPSPQAKVLKR